MFLKLFNKIGILVLIGFGDVEGIVEGIAHLHNVAAMHTLPWQGRYTFLSPRDKFRTFDASLANFLRCFLRNSVFRVAVAIPCYFVSVSDTM